MFGAKLFNKATPTTRDVAIDIAKNPCEDCSAAPVGGLNGITTQYPATLVANVPATPGTYTWSAAWHGGANDGLAHSDVYVQFKFDVVATPTCGDGNLDGGEECDDGNNTNGDSCASDCTIEPFCGDGALDYGEQCDDGNNANGRRLCGRLQH